MPEQRTLNPRPMVLGGMILAAAATRLLPHPPNMATITAIALFGGAQFTDRRAAFLVPLSALLLSDLVLGFYAEAPVVYASFALVVGIGRLLRRRGSAWPIALAALASSLLFYALTNLAVWADGSLYPHTLGGLITCYLAGVPFLKNTVAGDLFYTLVLFGGWALLQRRWQVLRAPAAAHGALRI